MNSYTSPSIAVVDLSPFLERSKSDKHFKLLENSSNNADISNAQRRAASELHKAFKDTGFAIVVNHGIEKAIADNLRELCLKYFSFEIEKKSALANHNICKVSRC